VGRFVKGDVVVVPFPYADLSQTKRRPALVLATFPNGDSLLCQITSQPAEDSILLDEKHFVSGSLRKRSYIRPQRLFTADAALLLYRAGQVQPDITTAVVEQIIAFLNA